jgi:hypothetical protein
VRILTSKYKIFPLASIHFSLVTDEQTRWVFYDAVNVSYIVMLNGRMHDELEKGEK